ncbi:Aprataxin and PNK-like factor [Acipenser ruthenus]|uniref:Aprataxin and PNK-like factor n=1 Tax=Acipenser ruthenus TaxID=7906 RepID=A0A662YM54_ACIRT|nr:Aprataxin and PNK-like factor [Acipenser ruthenus]
MQFRCNAARDCMVITSLLHCAIGLVRIASYCKLSSWGSIFMQSEAIALDKYPISKSVLADDSDEDGQSNEYDLEDSFINDEEDFDHTDEDSDYEPESDDSAKEDITELKKEAKQFVNRRK